MLTKKLISIIDDDEGCREAITGLMKSAGYEVAAFGSATDFLASPEARQIPCLIADVHMPGMTGTDLHRRLTELGYSVPTILITAYPDDPARARALAEGVVCYLTKPFDVDTLLGCVQSALQLVNRRSTAPCARGTVSKKTG